MKILSILPLLSAAAVVSAKLSPAHAAKAAHNAHTAHAVHAVHAARSSASSSNPASTRPTISYFPKSPSKPPPSPPARNKTCTIQSHNDGVTDDSPYILSALKECNNGGHVVFTRGTNYFVATALDLTFLKSIDIELQGNVLFSPDTTYWQANSFAFGFQNVTSFFKLGGTDVFLYGHGTLNGNGQPWYDLYAKNIYVLRPVLVGIDGLHDSIISDLVLRNSPEYYFFVANSTNLVFDGLNVSGISNSVNIAKNTDGWDTYRSSGITIQNSVVSNGDDCIAFKPNSTDVLVQNVDCTGSHGVSVGSLGQYRGEYDIVENIYVYNVSLHNSTNGARIKVWPSAPSALSGNLQGGGGDGRVNNITYEHIFVDNTDYAIEVDQCYGQKNLTLCLEFPSPLTITNIVFKDFHGTTSKRYDPQIGTFACSSETVCKGISATDINVLSPNHTNTAYCQNVDTTKLDVTCTNIFKGFN